MRASGSPPGANRFLQPQVIQFRRTFPERHRLIDGRHVTGPLPQLPGQALIDEGGEGLQVRGSRLDGLGCMPACGCDDGGWPAWAGSAWAGSACGGAAGAGAAGGGRPGWPVMTGKTRAQNAVDDCAGQVEDGGGTQGKGGNPLC